MRPARVRYSLCHVMLEQNHSRRTKGGSLARTTREKNQTGWNTHSVCACTVVTLHPWRCPLVVTCLSVLTCSFHNDWPTSFANVKCIPVKSLCPSFFPNGPSRRTRSRGHGGSTSRSRRASRGVPAVNVGQHQLAPS